MTNKSTIKSAMLELEAEKLAYVKQAYEGYLRGSAPDRTVPTDHGDSSQRFNESELAQAFECPLHSYEEAIAAIQRIDFGPKSEVEPGAVIRIDERWFVIAAATAPFECDGETYMGISPESPVYKCLEGKRAGDSCEWQGHEMSLRNVN
jgi:hypothetical protein